MNIDKIIKNEMQKSNGEVRIVKIPKEKKPSKESLIKLEKEIKAHVEANNAMMERSWEYANNK